MAPAWKIDAYVLCCSYICSVEPSQGQVGRLFILRPMFLISRLLVPQGFAPSLDLSRHHISLVIPSINLHEFITPCAVHSRAVPLRCCRLACVPRWVKCRRFSQEYNIFYINIFYSTYIHIPNSLVTRVPRETGNTYDHAQCSVSYNHLYHNYLLWETKRNGKNRVLIAGSCFIPAFTSQNVYTAAQRGNEERGSLR